VLVVNHVVLLVQCFRVMITATTSYQRSLVTTSPTMLDFLTPELLALITDQLPYCQAHY